MCIFVNVLRYTAVTFDAVVAYNYVCVCREYDCSNDGYHRIETNNSDYPGRKRSQYGNNCTNYSTHRYYALSSFALLHNFYTYSRHNYQIFDIYSITRFSTTTRRKVISIKKQSIFSPTLYIQRRYT